MAIIKYVTIFGLPINHIVNIMSRALAFNMIGQVQGTKPKFFKSFGKEYFKTNSLSVNYLYNFYIFFRIVNFYTVTLFEAQEP